MKKFSKFHIIIVLILSFLSALESLSIDLFLPAFVQIADHFNTTSANVQLSLATFLGGFAVGQLIWGPLSDRYGRKKPLIISLVVFVIASILCTYVQSIEQLWVMRFIQAVGGCGSIVVARAIVTDFFDKTQTLSIFAILSLIGGLAPIIAPIIGNQIIKWGGWKFTFEAMGMLGVIGILSTWFVLPETLVKSNNKIENAKSESDSVWTNYRNVLRVKQFVIYSFIAGLVNGALMLYIGNAPFLVMDKANLSGDVFSIVFALNALGMMLSAYITSKLQKQYSSQKIVIFASILMCLFALLFVVLSQVDASIYVLLTLLFFFVFPMGMLFPTTTDLAMSPFTENNSGSASSLFGALQLGIAFLIMTIAGRLTDGSTLSIGLSFLISVIIIIPLLILQNKSTLKLKNQIEYENK